MLKPVLKFNPSACDLTPDQILADEKAEAFLSSHNKAFLLTGYAGTGKTFCLGNIVTKYLKRYPVARVAMCAFSNKATKVLRRTAKSWGLGSSVKCLTTCAILGLRPKIENGKQVFRPDPKNPSTVDTYDLVIVDECSQINEEMHYLLMQSVANFAVKTQLIYVGDPAQLDPVGEKASLSFQSVPEDCHAHLGEVVRYDGAVGVLAETIRSDKTWGYRPVVETSFNEDMTKGVFLVSQGQFDKAIERAFTSESYHPDKVRIAAWRNRRVSELNQRVHRIIYGENAPRFIEGMTLTADKPVFVDGQGSNIIMPTSEEGVIKNIYEGMDGSWHIYTLDMQLPDEWKTIPIRVLHESEIPRFNRELEQLKKAKQWQQFYDMQARFAWVSYVYAGTSHKLQGSTYDDMFVDLRDMMGAKHKVSVEEFVSLAYVGVTRAAKRVFVVL